MVERLKLTHFYGAPTALRMLLKAGDEWVTKYDRSSLRILGCGKGVIIIIIVCNMENSEWRCFMIRL